MTTTVLQLTPRDPIIARDGRPFGAGQGNRMRSLGWPLPSVIAGAFRTTLVKASENLVFDDGMPEKLLKIAVAGVFPVHDGNLYLPTPNDAIAEPTANGKGIKTIHRAIPQPNDNECDFPDDAPLHPVMLPSEIQDFKPADLPAWWPLSRYEEWITSNARQFQGDWLDSSFLNAPQQETRDHVALDANSGTAADGQLFSTTGLNLSYLRRFHQNDLPSERKSLSFSDRYAEVTLSARVTVPFPGFEHLHGLNAWHPLGGERRLVHWEPSNATGLWTCPGKIKQALASTNRIRMVLATPAIFEKGWKPGWLTDGLEGELPGTSIRLKLVGVSNGRWKAVSGWSFAKLKNQPRGPKPIRRMVPAGSVYFFEKVDGDSTELAEHWLKSVSDGEQERRDGFGLAIWGTWQNE